MEAHLFANLDAEQTERQRAFLYEPPTPRVTVTVKTAPEGARGRARTAAPTQRRVRRSMTLAQARMVQSEDEKFQREMSRDR